MAKVSIVLSALLLSCTSEAFGQVNSTTQDLTFQVSSAQPWTDTGLDLQSGEVLEISATVATSPALSVATCAPNGISANVSPNDLALPSAPPGALIARLHAQGAAPRLVGASAQLHVEERSHLFLGMNIGNTPLCEGALSVKVRRVPPGATSSNLIPPTSGVSKSLPSSTSTPSAQSASTTSSSPAGTTPAEAKTRGEQLKSQLATAAQIFMSGQFGSGQPVSSSNASSSTISSGASSNTDAAAAAPPLKVSDAPLDAELRKSLDNLPRRVNDQFQNSGDMVNFVMIGAQKDMQAALDAASWHVADTSNEKAVVSAIMETYKKKDYLQMPMSTLYLFGRKQDFGYEMAEPIAMVASRHHFRIWKAPFTWKGQQVWVGAGTHDIGFAKDRRNGSVTHKIDPFVDGERDNIGSSLQKANKTKTMSYYLPPNPVQEAKNATGDGYQSDGRLLVIFLQ